MSHALEHAAVVVAAFVAIAMTVMFAAAWSAYRQERRSFILWITAAFAVFAIKSLALVVTLSLHVEPHELVELSAALLDLTVAALLLVPLLVRRTDD